MGPLHHKNYIFLHKFPNESQVFHFKKQLPKMRSTRRVFIPVDTLVNKRSYSPIPGAWTGWPTDLVRWRHGGCPGCQFIREKTTDELHKEGVRDEQGFYTRWYPVNKRPGSQIPAAWTGWPTDIVRWRHGGCPGARTFEKNYKDELHKEGFTTSYTLSWLVGDTEIPGSTI